jgi:beta-1,4-mannosyltransferase
MSAMVQIARLPSTAGSSPYYDLFYEALRRHGVSAESAEYDLAWFRRNQARLDWLHVHWVGYYYAENTRRATWRRAVELIHFLVEVRRMGLPLLWTLHNTFPHDSRSRAADYVVRLALARLANVVITHSREGERFLSSYFFRRHRVLHTPRGHLADYYPNDLSRAEARARLGLSDQAFVYLLLGALRPYKGTEELIGAFKQLGDDERSMLLIAGRPLSEAYGSHLQIAVGDHPRIRLLLGRVPDADLQIYLNAADLYALPFRQSLTSGTLMLAMSFGVPALIPPLPSLLEYVNPDVAYVLSPGEDLATALRRARARRIAGTLHAGDRLIRWARRFDWDEMVAPLVPLLTRRS